MAAGYYDWTIEQGSTWVKTLTITDTDSGDPRDLTGYTARMTIRREKSQEAVVLALTEANGRVSLTELSGIVTLAISAADTADLSFGGGVYDVELESGGIVERILEGKIGLSREVTF